MSLCQELSGVRLEVRQRDLQLGRAEKQRLASDSERQALAQQLQAVQSSLQNAIRYRYRAIKRLHTISRT